MGAEAVVSGEGATRDLIEQLTQRLEALSPSVKPLAEATLEGRWSLIYASRGTVRALL
jgi:hypothetical protein